MQPSLSLAAVLSPPEVWVWLEELPCWAALWLVLRYLSGVITGLTAEKGLEDAKKHAAEADVICEQLETGVVQCIGIRRRTYMFHNLLARLNAQFLPLIHAMEEIVANEGTNYATYKPESKKIIAAVASTAVSIKAILDTPILSADGALTDESEAVGENITLRLTD